MSAGGGTVAERVAPPNGLRRRLFACAATIAVAAAVIATARRPPILDLPQLIDQVARFGEVVTGQRSDLAVDWVGPNKAGALAVAAGWWLGGTTWGPRLALLIVAAIWIASLHIVAARARRPVSAAILVSPLLFGTAFYAGFVNFVVGAAALAFWTWELAPERRSRRFWPLVGTTLVGVMFFYFSHVLWLIVGGFAVATCVLLVRFRPVETCARVVGLLPVLPLLAAWSRSQEGSGWQTTIWTMVEPLERLSSFAMTTSLVLGGLRHPIEAVVVATLLAWTLLGGARAARERGRGLDPFLAVVAVVLGAVALLAPDTIDKTMLFAWRWGGFALAAAVLAVPPPRADGRWLMALALCAWGAHAVVTASLWRRYDQVEMAGFESALARVPSGASLLAFDAGERFEPLVLDPFVHLHVYATSERGASVAFTFADLGNSMIRRSAEGREPPDFVLWQPGVLRPSDVLRFSHLLVRCPPDRLERLARFAGLIRLLEGGGNWGLFEVARVAGAVALPPDQVRPEDGEDPVGGSGAGAESGFQRPASHQLPAASASPG